MARIVLVHGAFAGAWCWEPLIPELQAAGHDVVAIDLPGGGEDHTPVGEVTLDAYAERVCQALSEQAGPSVLVGHSMGGIAITQAAARCTDRISLLVYVCAFLPQDGQSLVDIASQPEGADDQIQANMVVEGDPPVASLPPEATRNAVYNRCTEEQAAWGIEHRRPQAVAPFVTPVSLGDSGAAELPRNYVLCTDDHSIPPALQYRMVSESPCLQVIELDTDHSPYLSRTSELAAALDRWASQASETLSSATP